MPRVKTGPYTRQRRNKWLRDAKGYWGGKSRLFKSAKEQVVHAGMSAYKERKRKKRVFRSLMIIRINAALDGHDLSYCRFINGLKRAEVEMDRSVISEMAVQAPEDFAQLVAVARDGLARPKTA
jgi:large subunit ribosomal protein L20